MSSHPLKYYYPWFQWCWCCWWWCFWRFVIVLLEWNMFCSFCVFYPYKNGYEYNDDMRFYIDVIDSIDKITRTTLMQRTWTICSLVFSISYRFPRHTLECFVWQIRTKSLIRRRKKKSSTYILYRFIFTLLWYLMIRLYTWNRTLTRSLIWQNQRTKDVITVRL